MQMVYEAPELKLIGGAEEVVLGTPGDGVDGSNWAFPLDFEFEQD